MFRFKLDKRRTSPDKKSERAISDHEILTLNYAIICTWKNVRLADSAP